MNHLSKLLKQKYNPLLLLLFSFIDIALFGDVAPVLQGIFTVTCYIFVIVTFLINHKIGLMYFISFNLLTIGWGNYDEFDNITNGYWGLRIAGFTLNILIQILLFLIIILKSGLKNVFCYDEYSKFFIIYFFWTAIIGTIGLVGGKIYTDNFINDLFTYLPLLFYLAFFKKLTKSDLIIMFKYVFAISIIALLWAYILDKTMRYSDKHYVVFDSLYYILPVGIFILKKFFNVKILCCFFIIMAFLFLNNLYFISGKTIILFVCLIVWLLYQKKLLFTVFVFCLVLIIPFFSSILETLASTIGDTNIAFKLNQVSSIFSSNSFMLLAAAETSVGNLAAEFITLITYLIQNPIYLIFGKGNGAGIPDIYGFLQPFCYLNGYRPIDGSRNDYIGLHLAFYMVLLRGGIFIFVYYLKICAKLIKDNHAISFLALIMLLFVFYASKDYLLLTFLLLRLSLLEERVITQV